MKSSLTTIQSLHKLGKVLSRIYFVLSIIGLVLSLALAAALLISTDIKDLISSTLFDGTKYGVNTLYGISSTLFLISFGEIFLSRKAEDYFRSELNTGTPFSIENALKLKKLGILTLIIPVVTHTLSAVVYNIMMSNLDGMAPFKFHMTGSVILAVMFIITSMLCRYGAGKESV